MIIGCDPGSHGGISFLDKFGIDVHPLPIFIDKSKGKKERFISVNGLHKLIDIILVTKGLSAKEVSVYVEDVHSLFNMSASSNFKMGYNLGTLHGFLDKYFSHYYLVKPKEWQGLVWTEADKVKKENGRTDTKKTSLNAARRIFPDESFMPEGKRTPQDGLFDSALIAYYGYQQ